MWSKSIHFKLLPHDWRPRMFIKDLDAIKPVSGGAIKFVRTVPCCVRNEVLFVSYSTQQPRLISVIREVVKISAKTTTYRFLKSWNQISCPILAISSAYSSLKKDMDASYFYWVLLINRKNGLITDVITEKSPSLYFTGYTPYLYQGRMRALFVTISKSGVITPSGLALS